jgi:AAA+ ATPase superfamily predicted ATPase
MSLGHNLSVTLPLLDRGPELGRIRNALTRREGGLVCLYGRRRLGKSRLLREVMQHVPAVYYVGDDRDPVLQRRALASEIGRALPGFDTVEYPDWDSLLLRWWNDAPRPLALLLDEFPSLVARAPELPSLLQKHFDRSPRPLLLCGSSQRMMHGLVLDASAPLYGRAREILRPEPLDVAWIRTALGLRGAADAIESYSVWGGVPRYWELARDYPDRPAATSALVLDPLGVLHREPERLLLDDVQDVSRPASILALIGQGSHRISEIGARLGVPATSLSRALARLMELGFVVREVPFGRSERDTKRTLYRLADPFLSWWYRFVEPNRSRLAAGQLEVVGAEVERDWPVHLGKAWERLARASVARIVVAGHRWHPASRWWGPALDRQSMEIDLVAERRDDPRHVLVGEAKLTASAREVRATLAELAEKAARCPELQGRTALCAVWVLRRRGRIADPRAIGPEEVVTNRAH